MLCLSKGVSGTQHHYSNGHDFSLLGQHQLNPTIDGNKKNHYLRTPQLYTATGKPLRLAQDFKPTTASSRARKFYYHYRFTTGNLGPVGTDNIILPVLNDEFGNGQDECFPRPIGVEVDLVLMEEIKEVGTMPPGDAKNRRLRQDAWGSGGWGCIVRVDCRFDLNTPFGTGERSTSVAGTHRGWVDERDGGAGQ